MKKTNTIGNRRQFIINALYYALIVGIVFLAFRYLFNLIWPFFVAFLFSSILSAPIRLLTEKCHLRRNISVVLCLILFFALLGGILVFLTSRIISAISDLVVWLPSLYSDLIRPALETLSDYISSLVDRISPETAEIINNNYMPNIISSISSTISRLSMQIVSFLSGQATQMPNRLVSAAICIISTVFMTGDFPRITAFVLRQIPSRPREIVSKAKDSLKVIIGKYGKSYAIIMGITFLEMLIGLVLIHPQNAFIIAVAIAIFDIFPIVGAGTILVPWSVITLLNGDTGRGIGLLILWVIEICVRQIMEPRIVGHQVGLHPIVTLMSMFIGTKLFGALGFFGLPITCAIVQSLDTAGVIHFIKHENPKEALKTSQSSVSDDTTDPHADPDISSSDDA